MEARSICSCARWWNNYPHKVTWLHTTTPIQKDKSSNWMLMKTWNHTRFTRGLLKLGLPHLWSQPKPKFLPKKPQGTCLSLALH